MASQYVSLANGYSLTFKLPSFLFSLTSLPEIYQSRNANQSLRKIDACMDIENSHQSFRAVQVT